MSSLAQYTFLPWFRRGLGNQLNQPDPLGPANAAGRASLSAALTLNANANTAESLPPKTVSLFGPGDVTGINPTVITKVSPNNNDMDFESNYLAFIEFYDEELPWRFSPASPNLDRLRPWLFLMVLKEGEFTINIPAAGDQAPTVTIQTFELPIDQAWAWAHVQVNRALAANNNDPLAINTELETLLKDDPDIAFSRILCPRKLEKNTRYQAFLLPYFESGRKAGLGEADPYAGVDRLQPAWPAPGSVTLPFPFYHSWSFATSEGGDIENLARRLQVFNPEDLKLPTVDINSLIEAFGADPTKASDLLDFSAALMPPGYSLPVWPGINKPEDIQLKESLRVRINRNTPADASSLTADPVVNVPPMYGQWHAAVNQLLAPSNSSGGINQFGSSSNNSDNLTSKKGLGTWIFPLPRPWLYELNLDPRYRAIAALGTETVRKNQEKFMDDAWEQVGAIIEANQRLRQAQLAIEVNKKMLAKHVESRSANDTVTLMAALHGKIKKAADQSILAAVRESKPSAAGVSPAFKKINRPGGKIARKVTTNLTQFYATLTPADHYLALFDNLNNAGQFNIIGAAPKKTPFNFNNTTSLNLTQLNPDDEVIANKMSPYALPVNAGSGPAVIENVNAQIIAAIQPLKAIGERILRIVPLPSVSAFPTSSVSVIKPVMAAPDLPYPMYEYLSALSPEFILPGLSEFPNNTVALLEPNKKFIEAYMAGLNHEMARELLWREYPTDQRGSYFRQFWNTLDFIPPSGTNAVDLNDIELMHTWNGKLGSHLPPNGHAPGLVLVFRGDLFRKFPNMIIFAQQAIVDPVTQKKILDTSGQAGTIKFPILKGKIPADITIVGFDLTPEQATAGAGWFFVFQERLGETRFGLDANQNPPGQMANWDDLDWAYIDNNTSLDVHPDKLLATAPAPTPPNNIVWGKDAAHVAFTLYQSPVLLGFHASDFMPPKPLVTTTDHNTNYIALS